MKLGLVFVFLAASVPAQRVLYQHVGPVNRQLGWSVRPGGDVDGDGFQDFVVTNPDTGGPAEVHVVSGSSGTELWRLGPFNQMGQATFDAVGVGDVDGDGLSDIAVAVIFELQVFSGGTGSLLYTRPPMTSSFRSLSEVGDFDSNGRADIAVAEYDGNGNIQVGVLNGINGAPLATLPLQQSPQAIAIVRPVGDLNGDGRQDLALGLRDRVQVLATAGPTGLLWTAAQSTPSGERTLETVDLDGDGKRELIVGRPSATTSTGIRGRVEVYEGSTGLPRFVIEMPFDFGFTIGRGTSGIGDLDRDGVGDLCLGAPSAQPGGEVLAFSGRTGEQLWSFVGGVQLRSCGRSMANLGDVDGDGFHDVALGCPSSQPASGWLVLSGKTLAEVTPKGGACGGGPFLPELGMTRPVLGQTATVACRDGAAGATGILAVSPAPAFPTYLGASTCNVWFDLGAATMLHGTTRAQWSIRVPVPGVPQLAGVQIALQCFYAPTGGPLGVDLSNGLWARLGF